MMKHLYNLLGFARTTQFPISRTTFQGNVRHDFAWRQHLFCKYEP